MKHRKDVYIKTAPQEQHESKITRNKQRSSNVSEVSLPEVATAFRVLMMANLCSALFGNISDCDETFNYWEPLHHLLYGEGFQTWEYSPVYAIRSWTYICVHSVFTWIFFGVEFNKLMVFYFIRIVLGVICTFCEVKFYEGVALRFGNHVAKILLMFLVFGTGMFISSTAFLPSTFCMYITFLFMGLWLLGQLNYAILAVACGAIIGWPFSAVIGIPLAIDIVIRRQMFGFFLKWCIVALITMLIPSFLIDSYFYGKYVVASLNILSYNVFSSHGPDLYGIEPLSYYIFNGVLNFNIAFILSILSILIIPLTEVIIIRKFKGYRPPVLLLCFSLSPMYLWFLIFFLQPHKEERFLFPVYPYIYLSAALVVAAIQKVYCAFSLHKYISMHWITAITSIVYIILSVSRILALFQGYHASIDIYLKLQNTTSSVGSTNSPVTVCIGKEWHRYPSSFFLPNNYTLQFIKSDFQGQLPQHFSAPGYKGTRAVLGTFNDQNLEETDRYVHVDTCHFLIDFDNGATSKHEPRFADDIVTWNIIGELDFLDKENSPSLFRAFFIPYYFSSKNRFGKYQLLQSKASILS